VKKKPQITMRTAVLLAVLLHVIILVLPQGVAMLLFFTSQPEVVRAEPLRFQVQPPQEQFEEPDLVPADETHEAVTPRQPESEPQTPDPYSEGQTNLKRLQTPQTEGQPQRSAQRSATETSLSKQFEFEQPQPTPEELAKQEEQRQADISEKLGEVLKQPLIDGDIPILYDQRKPSSSDPVEGMIQFDTYNWDYVPYRDLMLLKIYRYWVPQLRGTWQFNMGHPGRTIIRFTILRDGGVINVQLLDGSGIIQYDQAANYSIVQLYPGEATAFPPLPDHFPKRTLTVTIGFFVNSYPTRE